mgnify:CR=1 FL=1
MNLNDVRKLLDAKICVGEEYLGRQVETCCGSDLMSDVLAFTKCKTLLCTGLANMQVIRTADMTDLCGVILVRGKLPGEARLKEAAQNTLPIMSTDIHCLKPAGFFIVMA